MSDCGCDSGGGDSGGCGGSYDWGGGGDSCNYESGGGGDCESVGHGDVYFEDGTFSGVKRTYVSRPRSGSNKSSSSTAAFVVFLVASVFIGLFVWFLLRR